MTWTVQTTDLRRRARDILDRVRLKQEPVIIRSYDTPQAVLIPYEEFPDYVEWRGVSEEGGGRLGVMPRVCGGGRGCAGFFVGGAGSF